jgi:hypothetical protein
MAPQRRAAGTISGRFGVVALAAAGLTAIGAAGLILIRWHARRRTAGSTGEL